MRLTAIASLRRGGVDVGIRILNRGHLISTGIIGDYNFKQVEGMFQGGYVIDNIEYNNGEYYWSRGSQDRYSIINLDTGIIDNKNSIIVLGRNINKVENRYLVTNYEGRITYVGENKLIRYGEQYIIANCKVVSKDNVKIISSIRGMIENYPAAILSQDDSGLEITLEVPFGPIETLVIKDRLRCTNRFNIIPKEASKAIKNMVALNSDNLISSKAMGKQLINLKNIYIKRLDGYIQLDGYKNLEYLRLGVITDSISWFRVKDTIKKIEFDEPPKVYIREMFSNCNSLDMSNMFKEGLIEIQSRAFKNVLQLENIILPKSLEILNVTAFEGCKNIRSLRINNNSLIIEGGYGGLKLLDSALDAKLYCSYEFPQDVLDAFLAPHVEVVRDGKINMPKADRNKIAKGAALGLGVKQNEYVSNISQLKGFLAIIDGEKFKRRMIDLYKDYVMIRRDIGVIEDKFAFLRVLFGGMRYQQYSRRTGFQLEVTENYMVALSAGKVDAFLVSTNKINKMLLGKDEYMMYEVGVRLEGYGFAMRLPHKSYTCDRNDVKDVREVKTGVEIELKTGEMVSLKFFDD